MPGPGSAKLSEGFQKDALSYMLFLRLVPAFPFWFVNIAPAVLGVPLRTFVLGTVMGIIPATFAFASAGAGLDSVIMAAKNEHAACVAAKGADACPIKIHASSLLTKELVLALVLVGLVALIPVVLKRWKRGEKPCRSQVTWRSAGCGGVGPRRPGASAAPGRHACQSRRPAVSELRRVDLCVIGAGSGGLSVAAAAAQLGVSVALVEKHKMGGDCLNYGCVPSKALIAAGAACAPHALGGAVRHPPGRARRSIPPPSATTSRA